MRIVMLALLLQACAPPACGDGGDGEARHDVAVLIEDDGLLARAAQDRLIRRGRSAIPAVETGLYRADPAGRKRVIRTLYAIDPVVSKPIFAHLAAWDPDGDVRALASSARDGRLP